MKKFVDKYKKSNKNQYINERISEISDANKFSKPTDEQKLEFFNLYQTLYSINLEMDPQTFCQHLDTLINKIGHYKNKFADLTELHNYDFFQFIIDILVDDKFELYHINVISTVINFLNLLLQFKGIIELKLLDSELIERSIALFQKLPGDLTPDLLDMLTDISKMERITDSNQTSAEGLYRIFNIISIDDIYNIIFQSYQNSNNLDKDEMNSRFAYFIYMITSYPLPKPVQQFILSYISNSYMNGINNDYDNYIYILSKMIKYNNPFPIQLFCEKGLLTFVVDMIFQLKDKYIYPALKCLIQISEYEINYSQEEEEDQSDYDPNFKFPKIRTNLEERIFSIAFNIKQDSEESFKDSTRIAAFNALRIMIPNEKELFDHSPIEYLLNELVGGFEYEIDRWNQFLSFYLDLSYQLKYAAIDFLKSFISYGSEIQGTQFIEFLLNNDILNVFMDAIENQDENIVYLGIIGILTLIKECDNKCDGMFELIAIEIIDISIIDDIIDNAENEELAFKAQRLRSDLRHLPNRLFVKEEE